jgi:hypothetical protein
MKLNSQYGTPNIRIKAEDGDTATTFSNRADFDGRTLTTAYVDWSPATEDMTENEWIYSPDIKAVVQEVVDRASWDEATLALFLSDNSSSDDTALNIRSYDYSGNADGPHIEIETEVDLATSPTFFMYVDGGTEGEIHKLDENKAPSDVTQVAETHANRYRTQFGRFLQFGNDMLFTDDGKSDVQVWDVSTGPSKFIDSQATIKARYIEEFKSRLFLAFCVETSGPTVYSNRLYYSDIADATSITKYIALPLEDTRPTGLKKLTQDDLMVFKESATIRVVDRQTSASDFQAFVISTEDGLLTGNVTSDGARLYGGNSKGIFQWPVQGYPNGFRYIQTPIQDMWDNISIDKIGLVWFCHWPKYKQILVNMPSTYSEYNNICAVFNYELDLWENVSGFWAGNTMEHAYDITPNYDSIIIFGKEKGFLKYITGDDFNSVDFSGYFETGALYLRDQQGKLISRTLKSIEPISNYDGSMTLNFSYVGYDRPSEFNRTTSAWSSIYSHSSDPRGGNAEIINIDPDQEKKYHVLRVKGPLKDEVFEVQALKLTWILGGRT